MVTGNLGPWKCRAEFHQFIELARGAGYFNFQGFSRSKIPNIFQGFFINFSSIFMLHFVWTTIPTFGLLSLQTVFPFSWTISSVTRLLCLEKLSGEIWWLSQDNKYHVYYPTSLIKKLVQNETKQTIKRIKKCV